MIEIQPFDPDAATASQWAAFHIYRRIRAEEDEPGEPVQSDADFEHEARTPWRLFEHRRLLAWHDEVVVGNIGFGLRRDGTPGSADYAPFMRAWGGVCGAFRRQGVATALLRALLEFMDERDKTILTIGTHLPEGRAFLAATGATEKHREITNRLSVDDLDWDELARWEAAAVPPGSSLTWEIHAGRVPMARLAEVQPRFGELLGEVPMGALNVPPMRFDLENYVSWYADMDRRGGEHFLVLLRDGAEVVGICEAGWNAKSPDRVFQELTGVARPWRNRGLAKGLKAAMLRLVRERHPEVRTISTSNAETNAPILSINRRLGFSEYRTHASYQLGREALRAWLATR